MIPIEAVALDAVVVDRSANRLTVIYPKLDTGQIMIGYRRRYLSTACTWLKIGETRLQLLRTATIETGQAVTLIVPNWHASQANVEHRRHDHASLAHWYQSPDIQSMFSAV